MLLVEGIDDWHAIWHIVHLLTGAPPFFELAYCENDDGVLDVLSAITQASSLPQKKLGAILDADHSSESKSPAGIPARIRALKGRLEGVYPIPDEFPEQGLIISPREIWDKG